MALPQDQNTQLTFRSFSARILVDGIPLPVYAPGYDDVTYTASGWIAPEPGKKYAIAWRLDQDVGSDALGRIHLDGRDEPAASPLAYRSDVGKWQTREGSRSSSTQLKPFIFSAIKTTDDQELASKTILPDEPGTVVIKIARVWIGQETKATFLPQGDFNNEEYVDEQSKKIGCHITKLGEAQAIAWQPTKVTRPFESSSNGDAYVKFVFKVRALDILQANGVVPRPAIQDLDVEDGDVPDDQEAEAEIVAIQANLVARVEALAARKKVKPEEIAATIAAKRTRVKQHEEIDFKRFFTPGQVIDLTDL